jgi:hypothetical protein
MQGVCRHRPRPKRIQKKQAHRKNEGMTVRQWYCFAGVNSGEDHDPGRKNRTFFLPGLQL